MHHAQTPEESLSDGILKKNSEIAVPDSKLDANVVAPLPAVEVGGRGGLDPTRYGDWEKNGRCIDF